MWLEFLKSKRTWIVVIGLLVRCLAKYGHVFSDADIEQLAANAVDIVTVIGVVWTKYHDTKKETPPPEGAAN